MTYFSFCKAACRTIRRGRPADNLMCDRRVLMRFPHRPSRKLTATRQSWLRRDLFIHPNSVSFSISLRVSTLSLVYFSMVNKPAERSAKILVTCIFEDDHDFIGTRRPMLTLRPTRKLCKNDKFINKSYRNHYTRAIILIHNFCKVGRRVH